MRLSPVFPGPAVGLVLLPAAFSPVSCAAAPPADAGGRIFAWRLVESETPGGKELVLEAAGPSGEVGQGGFEVRLSRERAGVGEEVEAEIILPPSAARRWVEIHPGRPGVRILGPRAWIVDGGGRVTARFTCDAAGPGGILVFVSE